MSEEPKKRGRPPKASDILGKLTKKSPAGAIYEKLPVQLPKEEPVELPTVEKIQQKVKEEIKKEKEEIQKGSIKYQNPSSPKLNIQIDNDVKKNIKLDILLPQKNCTLDENYVLSAVNTSSKSNSITPEGYYIKLRDMKGTPFYIDISNTNVNFNLPESSINLNMIRISSSDVPEKIKYLVSNTSNIEGQLIECGNNSFCIVKNKNDGTNVVDLFQIPNNSELEKLKDETLALSTSKCDTLEPSKPFAYNIMAYDTFVSNTAIQIAENNSKIYNANLTSAIASSDAILKKTEEYMEYFNKLTKSFIKNKEVAISKINEFRNKKITEKTDVNNLEKYMNDMKSINNTLESFIMCINNFNKPRVEFVNIDKILINSNNMLCDNYVKIKEEFKL